nr:unnamed protein product [Haemonchus contortus]
MLRPTILVTIIGFATTCSPAKTVSGTETVETTLVSLMNWNQSNIQSFQQLYERIVSHRYGRKHFCFSSGIQEGTDIDLGNVKTFVYRRHKEYTNGECE